MASYKVLVAPVHEIPLGDNQRNKFAQGRAAGHGLCGSSLVIVALQRIRDPRAIYNAQSQSRAPAHDLATMWRVVQHKTNEHMYAKNKKGHESVAMITT